MLGLVLATAVAVMPAPECPVKLESRTTDSGKRLLRARPACPIGFDSTREAMRRLLADSGRGDTAQVHLGRLVDYPWLSALLERAGGRTDNASVARTLRQLPELGHLFPGWGIQSVSVEKVLVREGRPYDAIVWIVLRRDG